MPNCTVKAIFCNNLTGTGSGTVLPLVGGHLKSLKVGIKIRDSPCSKERVVHIQESSVCKSAFVRLPLKIKAIAMRNDKCCQ